MSIFAVYLIFYAQVSEKIFIRNTRLSDLPDLMKLEEKCWNYPLRATEETIRERISNRSTLQWVAELCSGGVVGVLYTQKISSIEELRNGKFATQRLLHSESGSTVQLIAINVSMVRAELLFILIINYNYCWCLL